MKLKNRRGSIFVFVSVILSIVAIFTTTIIFINMSNTRQVISQEEEIKAYYLAYSGADMAYAALFKIDSYTRKSIFDTFNNNDVEIGPEEIDLDKDGHITVVVNYDSERKTVTITSTGTYRPSNRAVTLKMSFNVNFPDTKLWE